MVHSEIIFYLLQDGCRQIRDAPGSMPAVLPYPAYPRPHGQIRNERGVTRGFAVVCTSNPFLNEPEMAHWSTRHAYL